MLHESPSPQHACTHAASHGGLSAPAVLQGELSRAMKLPGAVVGSMVLAPRDFQPWAEQQVLRCGRRACMTGHTPSTVWGWFRGRWTRSRVPWCCWACGARVGSVSRLDSAARCSSRSRHGRLHSSSSACATPQKTMLVREKTPFFLCVTACTGGPDASAVARAVAVVVQLSADAASRAVQAFVDARDNMVCKRIHALSQPIATLEEARKVGRVYRAACVTLHIAMHSWLQTRWLAAMPKAPSKPSCRR